MELHLTNLHKLCQVCGGKVVTKRVYVNAKTCSDYVDLLRTCFGTLSSEDKGKWKSESIQILSTLPFMM